MRTTAPRLLTALTVTATCVLAGCADTADDGAAPETITSTQTTEVATPDETTVVETTADAPVETVTDSQAPDNQAPETPIDDAPSNELPYEPVGSEVMIAGEPATICIHGDGWGTNVWAGNANTSCEFVSEVHQTLIEGLNPTQDNIRDHLREQVTVTSPVTGESYDMTCAPRDDVLVVCTGGADAAVYFY